MITLIKLGRSPYQCFLSAAMALLLCLTGAALLSCAPDQKITDRHQQALDEEDE